MLKEKGKKVIYRKRSMKKKKSKNLEEDSLIGKTIVFKIIIDCSSQSLLGDKR